ncbi:MAG: energy transducer TonB, partial [Rhodocyclaceae bacterium]
AKEAPSPPPAPAAPAVLSQPRFDADYLQNPPPAYPALSRRMGEEGRVVLRVFVEPNGRPSAIEVRNGSGSPRLDQAALDAVARWKFVAARRGDEAVGAWVLVPIVFNLRS